MMADSNIEQMQTDLAQAKEQVDEAKANVAKLRKELTRLKDQLAANKVCSWVNILQYSSFVSIGVSREGRGQAERGTSNSDAFRQRN